MSEEVKAIDNFSKLVLKRQDVVNELTSIDEALKKADEQLDKLTALKSKLTEKKQQMAADLNNIYTQIQEACTTMATTFTEGASSDITIPKANLAAQTPLSDINAFEKMVNHKSAKQIDPNKVRERTAPESEDKMSAAILSLENFKLREAEWKKAGWARINFNEIEITGQVVYRMAIWDIKENNKIKIYQGVFMDMGGAAGEREIVFDAGLNQDVEFDPAVTKLYAKGAATEPDKEPSMAPPDPNAPIDPSLLNL